MDIVIKIKMLRRNNTKIFNNILFYCQQSSSLRVIDDNPPSSQYYFLYNITWVHTSILHHPTWFTCTNYLANFIETTRIFKSPKILPVSTLSNTISIFVLMIIITTTIIQEECSNNNKGDKI